MSTITLEEPLRPLEFAFYRKTGSPGILVCGECHRNSDPTEEAFQRQVLAPESQAQNLQLMRIHYWTNHVRRN